MNEQENEEFNHPVALGVGIVAAGVVAYLVATRKERAKRKKIHEWTVMNHSAVAASKRRLMEMLDDPNATSTDFWVAWMEEEKFMRLIQSQPMY